ncbi:hypothetical protein AAC03nite_38230 [Alicyclobacillus acidoterrestris]|nr:hypothetical protein AAC03nite_38230 [Alicyclobacillus acidoterrestris]
MERMRFYWSKQLAEHLNIGGSTLRKWALALEKAGYHFERDEHGNRAFLEHDALALKEFKSYLAAHMTIESAAALIAKKYGRDRNLNDIADHALPALPHDERMERLEAKIDQLMSELRQREEERNRADERRDQALMQVIRQMQENVQLQIAATQEQKQRKRWFSLFSKKGN